jgi:hypothetical protein
VIERTLKFDLCHLPFDLLYQNFNHRLTDKWQTANGKSGGRSREGASGNGIKEKVNQPLTPSLPRRRITVVSRGISSQMESRLRPAMPLRSLTNAELSANFDS